MSATHSLAEWASVLSLGIGVHASFSCFYFLLVDAERADFNPRPLVRRAAGVVHQELVHTGHNLAWAAASTRHEMAPAAACGWHAVYSARETARDLAALLLLLTTTPKGGTR